MSLLSVENISKSFENTEVLKDISFDLEKGHVLSIIGASGSGKTTLLRCLNFLERPDKGRISINSNVIFDAKDPRYTKESVVRNERTHFGLVFQNFNLFPQYTALENVTLAGKLKAKEREDYKDNKAEILEKIDNAGRILLDQMGLEDRMDNYPHQLSGGQCQRVAIARALALKPDILCFDEPTSALDPMLTGEVLRVMRELSELKKTMIIVTHEMSFARDVSDSVMFLHDGIILKHGTPEEIFDDPDDDRIKQFLALR